MKPRTCKKFMTLALLLCCAILIPSCGGGSGSGSVGTFSGGNNTTPQPTPQPAISGTVRDINTQQPLPGAVISDGMQSVTADANGHYSIQEAAGNILLTASMEGYMTTNRVCNTAKSASVNWSLTEAYGTQDPPALNEDYVILAWNDLGMHCCQDDYSYFLILPPFNTFHAQVIQRGVGPVTDGITVSYTFADKKNSAAHTNFWQYAAKYGFKDLPENVGITGSAMSGTMQVDDKKLGFVAKGVPVTPYKDDGTWDPYSPATITVTDDATGQILQTADVTVPVSTELNCFNCHKAADVQLDILQKHDKHNGTTLVADRTNGTLHMCAECHPDNALGAAGKPGIKSLSEAMHGWHSSKLYLGASDSVGGCYNCHPGPKTNCLRGIMHRAGIICQDCHGNMRAMADSISAGRQPWLQEPRCGDCHGEQHQENPDTLFRNSVLMNTPNARMNGQIYCEGCHESTHCELVSSNGGDASISMKFQGDDRWIWNCFVCHTDYMTSPTLHAETTM